MAEDPFASGTRLDRYEIVRPLGQGAMGTVWLARQRGAHGFARMVAIKTLPRAHVDNPRFRAMLLDEARLCARLSHCNVAQILDVGEHAAIPFIVLEWVAGCSFEQLCAASEAGGGRLDPAIAVRIVADACAGLHAAHELCDDSGVALRVVHRDITPANVLVGDDGATKVIDFGIAKARDRMADSTRSGVVKGTPSYMAPEQATGGVVDRRADVWALGAVLYRALAGRPPFATRETLGDYVLGAAIAPLPPEVPAALADAVGRAMQRHAADRFATADDLRRALEAALAAHVTAVDVAAQVRALRGTERAAREPATVPAAPAVSPPRIEPPGRARRAAAAPPANAPRAFTAIDAVLIAVLALAVAGLGYALVG